ELRRPGWRSAEVSSSSGLPCMFRHAFQPSSITSHSSRHIARRVTSSTSICRKYYRTLTLAAGAFRYRGSIRSFPRSVHGERPTGFVEDPVRKAERDDLPRPRLVPPAGARGVLVDQLDKCAGRGSALLGGNRPRHQPRIPSPPHAPRVQDLQLVRLLPRRARY